MGFTTAAPTAAVELLLWRLVAEGLISYNQAAGVLLARFPTSACLSRRGLASA